jgi:hypothetical protein
MSLAYSLIDSNINEKNNDLISKKKSLHNKTQKKIFTTENFDSDKVNSVLEKINKEKQDYQNDEEEDDNLGDFNPPSYPIVHKKPPTQQLQEQMRTIGQNPQALYSNNNLDVNNYNHNYGNEKTNEEYYKKVLPGYNNQNNYSTNSDVILQKLNYMIHLLEEKQDEKTNNVTEEVILYSFLGIFIIYIVDSFSKVGKYVR